MLIVEPDASFHTVSPHTVFDSRLEDPAFQEYRRRWHEDPKNFQVGPFPIHLDIESTGVCNLRCPFCASTTLQGGFKAPGYMSFDLFQRIIDEGIAHGLCSIKLNSFRGEPLLHPQLPEMVAYAKSRGVLDVFFNTNATLLREATIHRLLDAGLDRLSISVEGASKETYEAWRVGAKFEEVVANIEALRRIREARGLRHPQIRIQMVLLPGLESSFPEYVRFWQPLADEVAYQDLRREGPGDDHRGQVAAWACPNLWQRMSLLWDGTLLPCLMHGVADFALMALGNVQQVAIKDMWLGEREEHFRRLHKSGCAHELEACDRCSYRGMELEKVGIGKAEARS